MKNESFDLILDIEIDCNPISERTRIFGEEFVKNNKEKCKMIYKSEEKELEKYYEKFEKKGLIKFKLKFINNAINMSHMFEGCNNIKSIKFNVNTKEFDMESNYNNSVNNNPENFTLCKNPNSSNLRDKEQFTECNDNVELYEGMDPSSISGTSNSNNFLSSDKTLTRNCSFQHIQNIIIADMSRMFFRCNSLISLPNISNWNTANVKDMREMLYECSLLSSLPDISKWDTSNVNNMSRMFYGCIH